MIQHEVEENHPCRSGFNAGRKFAKATMDCCAGRLIIGIAANGIIAAGGIVVLYLSWLSDSRMSLVPWIPQWIAAWADQNGTVRTGVPFVILGFILAGLLRLRSAAPRMWAAAFGGMVLLVATAELGQVWLPDRTPSWRDVGWGVAGGLLGLGVGAIGLQAVAVGSWHPGTRSG